jgi:hypothetical protein
MAEEEKGMEFEHGSVRQLIWLYKTAQLSVGL